MNLQEIREGWNRAAKEDAFYFILTDPEKKDGAWDQDEFFTTGREEIDRLVDQLDTYRDRALDFGCGVGRLTFALARWFDEVDGVDVSREMIARARRLANGDPRLRFLTNARPNLRILTPGYDLIYSVITLQHLPQDLQERYVREFVRLLYPTGLAVFQIPEGDAYIHELSWLSMFPTKPAIVREWVEDAGGELLDQKESDHSGSRHKGWLYTVGRQ